jgi:hypothetical protein
MILSQISHVKSNSFRICLVYLFKKEVHFHTFDLKILYWITFNDPIPTYSLYQIPIPREAPIILFQHYYEVFRLQISKNIQLAPVCQHYSSYPSFLIVLQVLNWHVFITYHWKMPRRNIISSLDDEIFLEW